MQPKDIYEHIFEYIKQTFTFERLLILSREPDKDGCGRVVYAKGIAEDYFINQPFTEGDPGILINPLFRNNTLDRAFEIGDGYAIRLHKGEIQSEDISQILAVPVITDLDSSRAEMLISIETRNRQAYLARDKDLLKQFASTVGFALQRTRQYVEKQELASRDGLTGLINHRTFQEKLRTEKMRATRQQQNIGLMMIDIDKFKLINDNYGHPNGDVVIKNIAKILQKEVRQDVDLVARYGGEEFVIMMINPSRDVLGETANRICRAVSSRPVTLEGFSPLMVTVSIGFYLMTPDAKEIKEALGYADQALYKAKHNGRNCVWEYT